MLIADHLSRSVKESQQSKTIQTGDAIINNLLEISEIRMTENLALSRRKMLEISKATGEDEEM